MRPPGYLYRQPGGRICEGRPGPHPVSYTHLAIVRSITHKVKYAVEDATGLKVQRIDVCVDDIV